jgi:hypothetical protein
MNKKRRLHYTNSLLNSGLDSTRQATYIDTRYPKRVPHQHTTSSAKAGEGNLLPMSFQSENEQALETKLQEQMNKHDMSAFERHIMQCCKAPEYELRKWLRKTLKQAGFTITEDAYRSDRCDKDKRYESVHNMLAVRGEKPRVCLVAHTDVCRDHQDLRSSEWAHWMAGGSGEESVLRKPANRQPVKVDPIVKNVEQDGVMRRIITDRTQETQVGGDDRLGVAINTWIALNTGYDMGLLFCTDEEIGLKSAGMIEMPELMDFELLLETDKGNASNLLVLKIGGEVICEYSMACFLLECAYDAQVPRQVSTGAGTDIAAIHRRKKCKNAVNCTIGYHNSIGAQADEYIDVQEARDAVKFVSEAVKRMYLGAKIE